MVIMWPIFGATLQLSLPRFLLAAITAEMNRDELEGSVTNALCHNAWITNHRKLPPFIDNIIDHILLLLYKNIVVLYFARERLYS